LWRVISDIGGEGILPVRDVLPRSLSFGTSLVGILYLGFGHFLLGDP